MKARVWMAIATLWFTGACDSDPTALPELAVDRVEIEPGTVGLVVGDTVRLVARAMTAGDDVLGVSSTHETYGSGDPVSRIYTVWADGSKLARRTSGELDKYNPAWRVL